MVVGGRAVNNNDSNNYVNVQFDGVVVFINLIDSK